VLGLLFGAIIFSMATTKINYWLNGKRVTTRFPEEISQEVAQERIRAEFPKAEFGEAPLDRPAPLEKEVKRKETTENLGKTPKAPEVQLETGRQGAEPKTGAVINHLPPPIKGTEASDLMARQLYPGIGDSVQIDVDKIPYMQRKDHHQFLLDHGLHAAHGVVVGSEVRGGVYGLLIETGYSRVWADALATRIAAPAKQPQAMQDESRKSPELMRKPGPGGYNLT
jgi:hypothetical protein